jgi:catechol 2,3-dioxygenase-like lactoylglutathione lyase family enzyme
MKLDVVVVPVSDVDRAKHFYQSFWAKERNVPWNTSLFVALHRY